MSFGKPLLAASVAGAANTATTLTIPIPGSGQSIYIVRLNIRRVATAALAVTALLSITSTNLPNNPTWRVSNEMALTHLTAIDLDDFYSPPIRSVAANTVVTWVMPAAGAAVSWHAVAWFFTSN